MKLVVDHGQTETQRNVASNNIQKIKRVVIKPAELVAVETRIRKNEIEDATEWREITTKPTKMIEEENQQNFAIEMSKGYENREHANSRAWKTLFKVIDLWADYKSWYVQLGLPDLEILIKDIVSRRECQPHGYK